MSDQLKQLKEMKSSKEEELKKEEQEKGNFYQKITKQLDDFKKEVKEEEEEKKSYAKALLVNMKKFEEGKNEVAMKVVKEVINETRITNFDRSKREKNIIIHGADEGKTEKEIINELFKFIDVKEEGEEYFRLGKKVEKKNRPIKVCFQDINKKRKFLSLLHKLQKAPESLKSFNIQHDLSLSERDNLNLMLKKAKEQNDREKPEGFQYKVRGPPFAFKIVKIANKAKN